MKIRQSRRDFLKLAGAGAVSIGGAGGVPALAQGSAVEGRVKFKLGMASYSLRKFTTEKAIEMTRRIGLKHIAFKSMHMPLECRTEQIREIVKMVRDAALTLYGAGVIYMNKPQEVGRAFEYAKTAGLKVIIGVPQHELLKLVDKKVAEYDIKVAIHNHGPGDELYPTPESIYERVKDLDERIGLCIDIGHTQRSGVDPSEAAEKYADRLHDVHIKDVDKAAAEGKTIEIGRGVIDIPKFLRTLIKINYTGVAAFEYEKDPNDPLAGLAESVGYVKGMLAVL